jgi:adenylosuccinate lyase
MDKVKEGGNRQELHEEIRKLSLEASEHVKQEGLDNDLFKRMCESKILNISKDKQKEYLDASKYIGRALEQVSEFLTNDAKPVLEKHKDLLGIKVVITK